MNNHDRSASTTESASTLLPQTNVVHLPSNLSQRKTGDSSVVHNAIERTRSQVVFTQSSVHKMLCRPNRSETFYWDRKLNGLGLRALQSGRRSWIYQYRDEHGRTRRVAIGNVQSVHLEAAREAARTLAGAIANGENPSIQRREKRAAGTILEIIDQYLPFAAKRQRPRSFEETKRYLQKHAKPLHHERPEVVSRRQIANLLESVAARCGPIAANHLRAALSALWSWSLRTGILETERNPVAFTARQPVRARERTLSDNELKAIWKATEDFSDYSRVVRLCLLTGCRRAEISGLRWAEIHAGCIKIVSGRMKGKSEHELALLPMIFDALPKRKNETKVFVFGRNDNGFSGWSQGKKELDKKLRDLGIKMEPWGLHDLRRTFSTRLHEAGVEPHIVEVLLAHKQQGVAAVYNRASFREAKERALRRWHEILSAVLQDK